MTEPNRAGIEASYTIENGVILSPGKFEGEPVFVPYFWEVALSGASDHDDGESYTFEIGDDDYRTWPELSGFSKLRLWENDFGFVFHQKMMEGKL